VIRITGMRLTVASMNENELRMVGQIESVSFIGL
jgi:hypothetical protein